MKIGQEPPTDIDILSDLQRQVEELTEENELMSNSLGVYADNNYWEYRTEYGKYGEERFWVWSGPYFDPTQEAQQTLDKIKN